MSPIIVPPSHDEAAKIRAVAANDGFRLLLKSLEAQMEYKILSAARIMFETPTPNGQAEAKQLLEEAAQFDNALKLIARTIETPAIIAVKYE